MPFDDLTSSGSEFQRVGTAIEKARIQHGNYIRRFSSRKSLIGNGTEFHIDSSALLSHIEPQHK